MEILALLLAMIPAARGAEGLLTERSPYLPAVTLDRLEAQIRQRGLLVFARFDHAGEAARAGLSLRATEVLLFGHPKGGTPLMHCAQSMGIDLPLKALAWTDEAGQSWLAFNDADYLAQRHDAQTCPALEAVRNLLRALSAASTGP